LVLLEKVVLKAEVETLFGKTDMIALALGAVGLLILYASTREKAKGGKAVGPREAVWIGLVQGLCLPFRGFSRSGATISTGLILRVSRRKAEDFSFALVLVLTPAVLAREAHRLFESHALSGLPPEVLHRAWMDCGLGMVLSFLAGLLALKWLSDWLEKGRWKYFGIYCLAASGGLFILHHLKGW
jgi:undecaprenyl-diphosphatase